MPKKIVKQIKAIKERPFTPIKFPTVTAVATTKIIIVKTIAIKALGKQSLVPVQENKVFLITKNSAPLKSL